MCVSFGVGGVAGVYFISNYPKLHRHFRFYIHLIIFTDCKSPAKLWYKIHVFYMGHTYQSTNEKSVASISDQREYVVLGLVFQDS